MYIPSEHPNPARTVTEQIDLVRRLVERYPDTFEMAYTADDVERIARSGKIASLIGIEGGVAIENSLAQLQDEVNLLTEQDRTLLVQLQEVEKEASKIGNSSIELEMARQEIKQEEDTLQRVGGELDLGRISALSSRPR